MISDVLVHPPPTGGAFSYNGYRGPVTRGAAYVDPVFGSTITRLTKESGESASDIYSKNGYWNADGSRMAHNTPGGLTIIDTKTGGVLAENVPGNFDGSFDPVLPTTWYFFDGPMLRAYSIAPASLGAVLGVKRFDGPLGPLGGSLDYIDKGGRYFVLNIGGRGRVWDKQTDTLYAGAIPGDAGDGWLAMSPDAKYVVTTIGERLPSGQPITSYAIDHAARKVSTQGVMCWSLGGDHGDLVSTGGKTFFVTKEAHSVAAIYAVDVSLAQDGVTEAGIEAQRSSNLLLLDLAWLDIDGHISCGGEWAYVSVESVDDPLGGGVTSWRPYKQEIIRCHVLTGEVQRLAHHRSRGLGGDSSYRWQPRVCSSWDGSRVAWASNMGVSLPGAADIYAITLAAPSPPPPPPPATTHTVEVILDGKTVYKKTL